MKHTRSSAVAECPDAVIDQGMVARAIAQINRYDGTVGKAPGRFRVVDYGDLTPSVLPIPAHRFQPYAENCGTELTVGDQSDGTVAILDPKAAMMGVAAVREAIDEAEADRVGCGFCNCEVEPDDADAGWLIIHVGRSDWAAYQARPICEACWHNHGSSVGCFQEAQRRYNPSSSHRWGYR